MFVNKRITEFGTHAHGSHGSLIPEYDCIEYTSWVYLNEYTRVGTRVETQFNKPKDLFVRAKPIFTLIFFICTTYGIQSSRKCYTEPYFVRLLVCLTSLVLLFIFEN